MSAAAPGYCEPEGDAPALSEGLRKRLEFCNTLPSLPGAAARIVELGRDPSASMADVADAVKADPALAAKVLRMANSPLYARRRHCDSFQQALVLLGLNATLTLALTFSLVTSLPAQGGRGLDYARLWRRSLLAATAARVLAGHLGLRNTEEAFLAALMQDIGMLALDRACPEIYQGLGPEEQEHELIRTVEASQLGCDHATVGAWLLGRWRLPDKLRQVIAASHELATGAALPADPELAMLGQAVALSGPMAELWMSVEPVHSLETLQLRFSRVGGMDGATLSLLIEQVASAAPEIEALFEMALLEPKRSEWILQEAREVIVLRNLQVVHESTRLREVAASLEAQAQDLEERSRRDDLTGAYNRGHLDRVLADWFADANRVGLPLSLVFVDLDDFKPINDRHGHHFGDQVLVETARALGGVARASDLLARYGGEEFVLLLPGCDAAGARRVCARMREAVHGMDCRLDGGEPFRVTASFGIATHGEQLSFQSCQQLLRAADRALYQAKRTGKDRFVEYAATSNAA